MRNHKAIEKDERSQGCREIRKITKQYREMMNHKGVGRVMKNHKAVERGDRS